MGIDTGIDQIRIDLEKYRSSSLRKDHIMQKIISLVSGIFFIAQVSAQSKHLTLSDFLKPLYDVSSLPEYISQSYVAEVSTFDRTGGNNDGFNGTYSFIRRNADSSLVIFDVKGTGVINRIWTPTPTDDTLAFYIDDTLKPSFTICYRDLFSGKRYPFIAPLCANQLGGFYCYLPIPFNKSCKIVLQGKMTRFHQVGYRLYPEGTTVEKFSLPLKQDEQQALSKIKSIWSEPVMRLKDINSVAASITPVVKNITLKPGGKAVLFESTKPGTIAGFELSSVEKLEAAAKEIDLKITWDNETMPAINCPLADYFGYAFGKPSMSSLLAGGDGYRNYSYFPMPFDKSARIELVYRKNESKTKQATVNIQGLVYLSNKKRNANTEGKFYVQWNRENPVPVHRPHTMLSVNGKGHFVGTALQAQGLKTGMTTFFEGDDSTVVDGELRMHGTGSEDFFNGGWYALLDCWDAPMSLPLSGALDYSIPFCRTGGYRFFINDKVSFEKSFFHSIEHGPEHNEVPSDYTSVSYYYCDRSNVQSLIPSPANTTIYLPDTLMLYPQLLDMGIEGHADIETKWAWPIDGMTFYYTVDDETKIRIQLPAVPAGNYDLYLDYVKSPGGASFSLWQRQTPLSDWIDGYNSNVQRIPMTQFAHLSVTDLNQSISFRFKTAANRKQFILNRIILIRGKK